MKTIKLFIEQFSLIKRLLPYIQKHKTKYFAALLLSLALTVVSISKPLILKLIIDEAVQAKSESTLIAYSALFVLMLCIGVFGGYKQLVLMSEFGIDMINSVKRDLFDHILKLGLRFFNKHQVGWIMSRIESDTEELKNFCSRLTIHLLMDILSFVGVFCIMFYYDQQIAGMIACVCAALFFMVLFFINYMKKIYNKARSAYATLSGFIAEYVCAIEIIQMYDQKEKLKQLLSQVTKDRYDIELHSQKLENGFWGLFRFFTESLLIIIILWVGIPQLMAKTMSLGKLIMFLEFSVQMTRPLFAVSENFNNIQRALVSLTRVCGLLDEKPDVDTGEKLEQAFHSTIEFKGVDFFYNEDKKVLKNVNFSINKGEKIALVGPSGGGKSTIASLLCRFYDPTIGDVLVDGKKLSDIHVSSWRAQLGLVLQDVFLFGGTILDNLRVLDDSFEVSKVVDAAKNLGADSFISNLPNGYETELKEKGKNLSQGEKQLLSFSRAMTFNPEILVLDEATASIDPHTEYLIQKGLDTLLEGRTALIIAHRLSTIKNVDKILFVENGEIIEQGSHIELIAQKGRYFDMLNLQLQQSA
ncbi:MAG: ABC transporter ATP-binding protein [Candidatus Cloacimonetes bacterium]|nr:ABC transporter ATP-binding protein [Candidatus Cloacimonadota bacterium]